ncbi:MAG: hypothetical protein ACRDQ4_05525 [Pseudonocardiaceae bacterium]
MTSVDELTQGLDQLRDSITRTAHVAPQVARQEIRREGRAYFRAAVVASVITSVLIGAPLALLASRFSDHEKLDKANAALFQSEAQSIQRLAQSAHDLGVQANAELTRRGLTPVAIPTLGTAPDSQVLAASSAAQVAAKIARESSVERTPTQIQGDIAAALAKLPPPPVGPAPQQLTAAVQAYLAANAQGLRGPQGDPGAPGKSAPCLAQPTQCQGAKGDQGLRGEPPVSWTVEESDGSITTCERVAGFDPAAPRYRCSHATPSSSAATTPTPRSSGSTSPKPGR